MSLGFNLVQGEAYARFWESLPSWSAWTLVFIMAIAGSVLIMQRSELVLNGVRDAWISAKPGTKGTLYVLWCLFVPLLFDGSRFANGFVRQDDFSFLQVVRENDRLLPQLLLHHNDHALPLFRYQVWLIVKLAGPDIGAVGLAHWVNGLIFFSCTGLLLAGTWLLRELNCSALARFVFPFLLWLWPGWGEFTAGFFTYVIYVQVVACGTASAAAACRYFRNGSRAWGALSLLFIVLAVGINTSGYSAFAIAGVFCLCDFASQREARSLKFLGGLLVTFLLLQIFFYVAFSHPYSPRELVQNPTGKSLSSLDLPVNRTAFLPVVLALLSGLGGVILGYVAPIFLQFYNARLSPNMVFALTGLQLAVFVALTCWFWPSFKRLGAKDRILAVGLGICMLSTVGMLALARPHHLVATPIFLWHPKYLVFSISWLCLGGVFLADRCRLFQSPRPRPVATRCVFLLLVGMWFTYSIWSCERALLPGPTAYIPRGRYGNEVTAKARFEQYQAVMKQLKALAEEQAAGRWVELPYPEKWSEAFFKTYTLLEWGGDFTPRGVTHLFWDMPAADPHLNLSGRWVSLDSLDDRMRQRLMGVPWIAPAFRKNGAAATP